MLQIKNNLEKYTIGKKSVFLFTGDKGSTLLLNVVKDTNIEIVFIDTGYHFEEIINYVKSYGGKIKIIRNNNASGDPAIDMDKCCYQRKAEALQGYLKNNTAKFLIVPFRNEEEDNGIEGSYLSGIDNVEIIRPLADLSERDMWLKIKEDKLVLSTIYNKAYKFVDCKFCTTRFGRKKQKEDIKNDRLDRETEEKLKALGYM